MNLKMLLFLANRLKLIQSELRAKELLDGLTLVYELPPDKFSSIQEEVYRLAHPAMEGYVRKRQFEVDLLDVKFAFVEIEPEPETKPETPK